MQPLPLPLRGGSIEALALKCSFSMAYDQLAPADGAISKEEGLCSLLFGKISLLSRENTGFALKLHPPQRRDHAAYIDCRTSLKSDRAEMKK
jgi:hypothetical protein